MIDLGDVDLQGQEARGWPGQLQRDGSEEAEKRPRVPSPWSVDLPQPGRLGPDALPFPLSLLPQRVQQWVNQMRGHGNYRSGEAHTNVDGDGGGGGGALAGAVDRRQDGGSPLLSRSQTGVGHSSRSNSTGTVRSGLGARPISDPSSSIILSRAVDERS